MARTKQPIEYFLSNNLHLIHEYFSRAIRNEKLFSIYAEDTNKALAAKKEFKELLLGANSKESINHFATWIKEYISVKDWEKCKTAVRQKMLAKKRKHKFKSFRVPSDIASKLSYYAKVKGVTNIKALEELIISAYKKC